MSDTQDRGCPVYHGRGTVKPGLTDLIVNRPEA